MAQEPASTAVPTRQPVTGQRLTVTGSAITLAVGTAISTTKVTTEILFVRTVGEHLGARRREHTTLT